MSRKFDEKEVALIFQKATEPVTPAEGQQASSAGDLGGGLDLRELKEIAVDVGVDPTRVDEAARSLMIQPRESLLRVFVGTSTHVEIESEFDVRLNDEIRGDLLREIRTVMDRQGVTEGQAGSLEWKAEDEIGKRYVTISPSSAGTRLSVTGKFKSAEYLGAALGAMTTGVGTLAVLGSIQAVGALGFLLAPVVAVGAIVIPRLTLGRIVARETRRMSQLATRLKTLLSSRQPPDSAEGDT